MVLTGVIRSEILYFIILTFRVPCAAWLLCHGCFFALGVWLFISARRKLTALEWLAVSVACLSGCAEIFFFSSFLLTHIPMISGQSAFVPIAVWAVAVFLMAVASRHRRSTSTASADKAGYLRTLGLITYPLYLTHNVIGSAIVHVLIQAGLAPTLAVWAGLGMLVLLCWLICAKIEPAIRQLLVEAFSSFRFLSMSEFGRFRVRATARR
jgi:peptidoglycan/LPS O-acetylase OafA/YrhL